MTDAPTDLRPLIIQGHAVEILQSLPDGCCRCAVTSPPYYGLRRYDVCSCSVEYVRQDVPHPHPQKKGTSVQRKDPDPNCAFCHGTGVLPDMDRVWGGDPECKHDWAEAKPRRTRKAADQGATSTMGTAIGANYDARSTKLCAKCGAWFGSLGLEPTPQLYVQHLTVDVLGEIQRVLAEDGSLWLNLGDSYSTHPAGNAPQRRWVGSWNEERGNVGANQAGAIDKRGSGIKEKDLYGIPFRTAFALQDLGWYWRSTCIWAKPNPGRDSTRDRPLVSHEYVFLFTKSASYHYDDSQVRQVYAKSTLKEIGVAYLNPSTKLYERNRVQDPGDVKRRIIQRLAERGGSTLPTVWSFPTASEEGAHFATFPEELPEICIAASTEPNDLVLDPFVGSGTTPAVARRMSRRSIGIEINPQYVELARRKCEKVVKRVHPRPVSQVRLPEFAEAP